MGHLNEMGNSVFYHQKKNFLSDLKSKLKLVSLLTEQILGYTILI